MDCEIKSPLFANLSENDLVVLNQDRFVVSYQPGELIFKQGSSLTHVVMLITGLVKCYLEGSSKDLIIRIAKPLESIIGLGLFIDNKHYNSAMALVPVEACYINLNNFKNVVKQNPAFAEDVIRDISTHSLFSFHRLKSLTQKQAPGRIAEALLHFSNDIYFTTSFYLNLSRQELADYCGVTKESTIRVLKDFKDEGLITVNGNHFDLLDPLMMQKISEIG
ncbi:MAG: Crp/Fnr family transcriptional regulator [Bacteroidales bacterium]